MCRERTPAASASPSGLSGTLVGVGFVRSGFRPGGLGRRIPDGQPRRHHQLRPHRVRSGSRNLHRRRLRLGRLRLGPQRRGTRRHLRFVRRRRDSHRRARPTSRRSRSSSTSQGVEALNLDAATLALIFKGDILNWNDPRSRPSTRARPCPTWPITAVHRSDDSGTTKNFTDYLNTLAPEVWDQKAADAFPYQSGEGAQGTSGSSTR